MRYVIAFILLFAVSMANGAWIFGRMKSSHRGLWKSLGEPSLSGTNLAGPRLNFMRWIWTFKFLKVQDESLRVACGAALVMEAGLAIVFALSLAATV